MLTSLDFLNVGQRFPPDSELDRLDMYKHNKSLFESGHVKEYEQDLKRIERVIGNFEEIISYPIVLNWQKCMSLKIADLLVGEPPRITSESNQEAIDKISHRSDLVNTAYSIAIDVSRYGDGLLYVRKTKDGGVIDLTQPNMWFPVVSPDNVKEFTNHVLAWVYDVGTGQDKKTYLKCQIHNKGSFETREYLISNGAIDSLKSSFITPTGLDDFAVLPVPNIITSDRAHGIDDYTDIDSIVAELMVRVGQVSRILDKHASPSMQGPSGALEQDPISGQWRFKSGSYIPLEPEDREASYLTWGGELESNFKHIERLTNYLYTISEMGSAIFGDIKGSVESGSALKRLMVSPLAKVNRIRMRLDHALKNALKLCGQLDGVKLDDVSIVWQDGLPGDPVEESLIMFQRTAQKATMSQKRAMMTFDGLTEADAEADLEQIMLEESMLNPMQTLDSTEGLDDATA